MEIERKRGGREMIATGIVKVSDFIKFLEIIQKEHGDYPIAIPRCPTEVVMGKGAYEIGYGENVRFSSDQISTTLASVGPEIEW